MKFVRKKWPMTLCNFFALFITWFLCGIWHGAAWNYLLYGIYYFIFIFAEHAVTEYKKKKRKRLHIKKKPETALHAFFAHVYTLLAVLFGQLIFRSTGVSFLIMYVKDMFGIHGNAVSDNYSISTIMQYTPVIIAGIFFAFPAMKFIISKLPRRFMVLEIVGYIVLFIIGISFTVSSTYNPFIYFNF